MPPLTQIYWMIDVQTNRLARANPNGQLKYQCHNVHCDVHVVELNFHVRIPTYLIIFFINYLHQTVSDCIHSDLVRAVCREIWLGTCMVVTLSYISHSKLMQLLNSAIQYQPNVKTNKQNIKHNQTNQKCDHRTWMPPLFHLCHKIKNLWRPDGQGQI